MSTFRECRFASERVRLSEITANGVLTVEVPAKEVASVRIGNSKPPGATFCVNAPHSDGDQNLIRIKAIAIPMSANPAN